MFTIKNGTDITFPIGAIHRDPNLFFNPEEFDPERFSDENRKKIPSGAYLPFGLVMKAFTIFRALFVSLLASSSMREFLTF